MHKLTDICYLHLSDKKLKIGYKLGTETSFLTIESDNNQTLSRLYNFIKLRF